MISKINMNFLSKSNNTKIKKYEQISSLHVSLSNLTLEMIFVMFLQSGASYPSQDFVMFFHVSCEGLPGQ